MQISPKVLVPWKRLRRERQRRRAPNDEKAEYAGCRGTKAKASDHAHRKDLPGKNARQERESGAIPRRRWLGWCLLTWPCSSCWPARPTPPAKRGLSASESVSVALFPGYSRQLTHKPRVMIVQARNLRRESDFSSCRPRRRGGP